MATMMDGMFIRSAHLGRVNLSEMPGYPSDDELVEAMIGSCLVRPVVPSREDER